MQCQWTAMIRLPGSGMSSTSVNLYKPAAAALGYISGRYEILTDELNFPSGLYVLKGITEQKGGSFRLRMIRLGVAPIYNSYGDTYTPVCAGSGS